MVIQARREPRRLDAHGPTVFPIALGCMGMSGIYGPTDAPSVPIEDTIDAIADLVKAGYVRHRPLRSRRGDDPSCSCRSPDCGLADRGRALAESLGALDVSFSADDLAEIERAIPASAIAGTRYDEHQMRLLDSER